MSTQLDLRELAVDRSGAARRAPRRRRVVSRYVLPAAIALAFAGMLAWAARDRFLPARQVTVVPVVVTRADVQQAGTELFQAAGWIEPRPTPVVVSALAEGVVEDLFVVAGQNVQKDEPLARLIDVDAKLALRRAEADLALRQAELASATAELTAAELRREHPVHLDAALSDAQALLAETEGELAQLPFAIEAARAREDFARRDLEQQRDAPQVVTGRQIQQAQSELDSAVAARKQLEQRRPQLGQQVEALRRKAAALRKQRDLLIEETRHVADARAQVQVAESRRDQAALAVEAAELQLARMTIRAPVAGRVLELVARPGTRVSGLSLHASQDASTVVTLYDPQSLQVRADVRLEDVPLVTPGQPVEIETASAKELIRGEVLSVTSSASIQKNTLEVKVAIHESPPTIRPEMLVTATFLAPEQPDGSPDESERQRLLVPRELVAESDGSHRIWVADASGVARHVRIRLGRAGTAELVEVLDGLAPTDRLIVAGREALSEGDRISIIGEDNSIGIVTAR